MVLRDERARYVSRTLRLGRGDRFTMFDGSGGEFQVLITGIAKGTVTVLPESACDRSAESPLPLWLLQGVSRGERMDTVVQKATELGVSRITPLLCEFSVVRLDDERAARRRQHWIRVAQSACEQCGRNSVPAIDEPMPFAGNWMASQGELVQKIVLHPSAGQQLGDIALQQSSTAILVGPEGGLSPAELEQATAAGFLAATMGPRILRTETAAIAATAILQSRLGDI